MTRPSKVTPDDVIAAVAAHPGSTAADLAATLGIGQSTAAKHLAALEKDGRARRSPVAWDGGRQVAARWSAVGDDPPPAPSPASGGRPATRPTPGPATDPASELGPRLSRGELAGLVERFVTGRPDESFGPSAIGKALGRSSGAVANALSKLSTSGTVRVVGDHPLRYQASNSDPAPTE